MPTASVTFEESHKAEVKLIKEERLTAIVKVDVKVINEERLKATMGRKVKVKVCMKVEDNVKVKVSHLRRG